MCLACEMDGWWFGETEAELAGTAGVPPMLDNSLSSDVLAAFFAETTDEDIALLETGGAVAGRDAGPAPAAVRTPSRFLCEETPSE